MHFAPRAPSRTPVSSNLNPPRRTSLGKLGKIWKSDETGVVHDCVIACIVGVALFVLVVFGIYLSGYKLSGLPF